FPQFISIRTTARTCGHISLTKHFEAWKGMGMTMGKMYEAKVLVEAGGGMGRIDFPVASVTAQQRPTAGLTRALTIRHIFGKQHPRIQVAAALSATSADSSWAR